ncbi:proline-rich membrane anchor 1 isoform X2 [Zootoca vivipara]|uniref:proline-rich membrane anchor 1 isoform X2 n=1 Tax=Zootoca vivipara TaxID=8524 RepID=UPI00293BFA96|nr:proline-rich membrane anchor 1 isoform X2 [Zootoca vivipara]
MLIREVLLLLQCCWSSLLLHWTLHPIWGFIQITQGEPQKSCAKPVAEKVTDSCQQICQCRPPPLPPPPPPPPPPRLLGVPSPTVPSCPTRETWWPGPVIIIAACCTTLVFLFLVFIICYKAIKRHSENAYLQAMERLADAEAPFYNVAGNQAEWFSFIRSWNAPFLLNHFLQRGQCVICSSATYM